MTYFVFQSLLYTALVLWTWRQLKHSDLSFEIGWNLAFILMFAGFLGARGLHVLYESREYYFSSPQKILAIWEGGFVFFGGFLVALPISAIYLHFKQERFLIWADFYSPIVSMGYAVGRVGCLLTGCCYGQFCDLPWAVSSRHPTQLYASLWELLLFSLLWKQRHKEHRPTGHIFYLWLLGHSFGRILMEQYRADFRGSFYFGLSISSWLSFALFLFALGWWIQHHEQIKQND